MTDYIEKREAIDVVSKIPFGRDNAISRLRLSQELGISDRKVRWYIEQARKDGLMIVNDGDGKGYYQTDNLDEIEAQYRKDTARAMSILSRRNPMRDLLKEAGKKV